MVMQQLFRKIYLFYEYVSDPERPEFFVLFLTLYLFFTTIYQRFIYILNGYVRTILNIELTINKK